MEETGNLALSALISERNMHSYWVWRAVFGHFFTKKWGNFWHMVFMSTLLKYFDGSNFTEVNFIIGIRDFFDLYVRKIEFRPNSHLLRLLVDKDRATQIPSFPCIPPINLLPVDITRWSGYGRCSGKFMRWQKGRIAGESRQRGRRWVYTGVYSVFGDSDMTAVHCFFSVKSIIQLHRYHSDVSVSGQFLVICFRSPYTPLRFPAPVDLHAWDQ